MIVTIQFRLCHEFMTESDELQRMTAKRGLDRHHRSAAIVDVESVCAQRRHPAPCSVSSHLTQVASMHLPAMFNCHVLMNALMFDMNH